MKNRQADRNTKVLILTECLRTISNIFMETFLLAFIFKSTQQNTAQIGLYHFLAFTVVMLLAYLTGNWLKRGNRISLYKLGVIVTFIYMLIFIFLKNNITHILPLCGIIYGTKMALRAFPFNLIVADNIGSEKLISFKGYVEGLKSILKIIIPIILGILFSYSSYFKTVTVLAILSAAEFFVFSLIKATPQKHAARFNIAAYLKRTKELPVIKDLYCLETFRGMTIDGALETLVILYIVYLFKTDFNLGIITSIFYCITIIIHFAFGRFCKYRHFTKVLILTGSSTLLAVTLFILLPNKSTFIFYNFCFTIAVQILRNIADINMFNISNHPIVIKYKSEYFATREIFLNIGRLISYGILIIVGFYHNFIVLKYLLGVLTLMLGCLCWYCIKLNKKLNINR